MRIGKKFLKLLNRFKYLIVIIVGVALITVLGENSLLQRYRYKQQIASLEDEIERQDARYQKDSIRLSELEQNPDAIRKIARERYFMKASDEDIFVFSDEIAKEEEAHEAVK